MPRDFEAETPFTYKGRKFGKQEISSFIKEIAHTSGYSFKLPSNFRTKQVQNSFSRPFGFFKQNSYRADYSQDLAGQKNVYYKDWWKTISLHRSDVGLNRNYAVFHSNRNDQILSKKDRVFDSIWSSESFFPCLETSRSLEKARRTESAILKLPNQKLKETSSFFKKKRLNAN